MEKFPLLTGLPDGYSSLCKTSYFSSKSHRKPSACLRNWKKILKSKQFNLHHLNSWMSQHAMFAAPERCCDDESVSSLKWILMELLSATFASALNCALISVRRWCLINGCERGAERSLLIIPRLCALLGLCSFETTPLADRSFMSRSQAIYLILLDA